MFKPKIKKQKIPSPKSPRLISPLISLLFLGVCLFAPFAAKQAHAAVLPVQIIPRSEWLKNCPTAKSNRDLEYYRVEKIIIHHTAGSTNDTLEKGKQIVDGICTGHVNSRGWNDIGYNYLIDPLGNIYEGRLGGEGVKGYHANHANPGTIGISLIGDYSSQNISPQMRDSLINLLADLSQRYQINPAGTGVLEHSCYSFNKPNIAGHRDYPYLVKNGFCQDTSTWYNSTACPGDAFYKTLNTIRQAVTLKDVAIPANGVFLAEYYNNRFLTTRPTQIITQGTNGKLNFNWGEGSPLPGILTDNFSARWRGMITVPETAIYTFSLGSDDGSRLYINNQLVIDQWQDQGYTVRTADVGLSKGKHQVRVEYYEKTGAARISLDWQKKNLPDNTFLGEYFGNAVLQGTPLLVRKDESVNFDWKTSTPDSKLGRDYFSVRWTGTINIAQTNNYLFSLGSDDRSRLYIGDLNIPLIDAWQDQVFTTSSAIKSLQKGTYPIKVEYAEITGSARVALSWAPAGTAVFSSPGGIDVHSSQGALLMTAPQNQVVNIAYSDVADRYYLNTGSIIASTSDYLVISPKGGSPPLINYENYPGTYKQFRGQILVRASSATKRLNIINRVNIEDYLKGLGETGLNSDLEYTKAIIIAARTYALYHKQNGGKHKNDFYDLNNTGNDQVYLGYGYELLSGGTSNLSQAVDDTKGKIITHPQSPFPNQIIIATYYSQTGATAQTCGREKGTDRCTWNAGTWHWIPENGVADPWWMKNNACYNADNTGRTGAGHGYGLSGRGAYCFATQENRNHQWLLNYYFNNINISSYPQNTSQLTIDIGIHPINFMEVASEKYPEGMLVKSSSSPQVYMLQSGQKRLFRTGEIFLSYGLSWNQIATIPDNDLKSFANGPQMTFNGNLLGDGSIIKTSKQDKVYLVEGKYRRLFPSAEIYTSHGHKWSDIRIVSIADMNKYAEGSKVDYLFTPLKDGSLIKGSSTNVYLVDNGLIRHIPSADIFLANGYSWGQIVTVSDLHLNNYEKGSKVQLNFTPLKDGSLLKTPTAPDVFLIEQGKKRNIPAAEIFLNHTYKWSAIQEVHPLHLDQYPAGDPVLFKNGSLINASGHPEVYLIEKNQKRHIKSADDFLASGFKWNQIITTSNKIADLHKTGKQYEYIFQSRPDQSLFKTADSPVVYQVFEGTKKPIPNAAVFLSWGFKWADILTITKLEISYYPQAAALRFQPGALVKAESPQVYLIENNQRRHIPSSQIFLSHGFKWSDILETDSNYLNTYKLGSPLGSYAEPPESDLDNVSDLTAQ